MFENKISGSLDIGSSSVKGVSLRDGKIDRVAMETVTNGAILSGNIEDHAAVTDSIVSVVRALGLRNKAVIVSLPVQNFFVKFLNVVRVDETEKLAIIESELEELVPNFDPDEYITQYVGLDEFGGGDFEDKENVLAITIQKEKVEDIIRLLTEGAKVTPLKIIPDFISLFNLLQFTKGQLLDDVENANIMVVDIGAEATKIFVERNGYVKMQRIAAIGGNDFTDVIERNMNLNYDEAEKQKFSLELKDRTEGFEIGEDDILQEIGELVEELNNQIKRSVEFYKSQEGVHGIDALVVTGGASIMKGYEVILETALMTEMKVFPLEIFFNRVKNFSEKDLENLKRFGAVIGNIVDEVRI